MFSKLTSIGLYGIDSHTISIEVDISKGMESFDIVGLPDAAIKESRDRVRSSVKNCGYRFPDGRIVVNLAPADLKKTGTVYDLPILIALLQASGQLEASVEDAVFLGQLSLSGEVKGVPGVLPMVLHAKENGFKRIFIPMENSKEGGVVEGITVYGIEHVQMLLDFLTGDVQLAPQHTDVDLLAEQDLYPDFADVKGQFAAKRALEVAAAGGHNALLIGPPGAGKSMLAKRLPSILPNMTFEEAIETTKIYSVANHLDSGKALITTRPFRSPHHTISPAGLSGGGSMPKPGEISLSHNGILFLDELPEFNKNAMEVLRQPMEDGTVTIARVNGTLTYPCSMMLIAAMNPCPCGNFGSSVRKCTCTQQMVSKYLSRVSGPLLDRLDLHIDVAALDYDHLASGAKAETSADIRARVNQARQLQQERYREDHITCNARLTPALMGKYCKMSERAQYLLKAAFERMGLSARAYDRILKVARTIADLEKSEIIEGNHIAEAVQYRSLDRKYWAQGDE